MNKAYNRINWENYPSDSTPLNEDNLNKMDIAINEVDNRVISLDTTKLPVATAYTMVKDVAFDEKTGIFTITKLNGSVIKIDTALEKISTNFRFDHSTQKLILTLIDGTTQEVDLSALLTQYEFTDSDTIAFTIDTSGKVVASVKKGSITQDMLEPNYLANIKVEVAKAESASLSADTSAKNAKTSETNAKTSEEKAREYAEAAGGIDALISSFATGTNPTIQDSTNAPLIYGKFKGYTLQDGEPTPDNPIEINGLAKGGAIEVKTTGKNIFGGLALAQALVDSGSTNVVLDTDAKTVTFGYNTNHEDTEKKKIFSKFKENTQYTFILDGTSTASEGYTNLQVRYTDGNTKILYLTDGLYVSEADKTIAQLKYEYVGYEQTLNYEQCGIFEGVITADEFEPYTETTAVLSLSEPLYEGDYIEYRADGSGKLVRARKSYVFDGDEGFSNQSEHNTDEGFLMAITMSLGKDVINRKLWCDHFSPVYNAQSGGVPGTCSFNPLKMYSHYLYFNVPYSLVGIDSTSTEDKKVNAFKAWLSKNPVTIVYKIAEPTETPLTAEQVAQFKQLYTFEPVTNVLCDGEVELLYYKNTDNGETVGIVHKKVEVSEKAIEDMQTEFGQLPNTFAKKSLYGDTTINVGRLANYSAGEKSISFGTDNVASSKHSCAIGANNTVLTSYSFAFGNNNEINDGLYAYALGKNINVDGAYSFGQGLGTATSGAYAFAQGIHTTALTNQHAQGHYNDTSLAKANSLSGTTSTGTAFVIGNGTDSAASNAFRVMGNGIVYSKGAYNTTGADYAEYLEWADGNTDDEDRRGYFVTFDEEKPNMIRKANDGDYILGIVSGNPCIIGNSDEGWRGRYVFDEFGCILYENREIEESYIDENGEEKTETIIIETYQENPDYDPTLEYVHREFRKEWAAVGFIGVLSVRDDNTCVPGGYCKVTYGGIATTTERGTDTYRVLERINDNVIKVALK